MDDNKLTIKASDLFWLKESFEEASNYFQDLPENSNEALTPYVELKMDISEFRFFKVFHEAVQKIENSTEDGTSPLYLGGQGETLQKFERISGMSSGKVLLSAEDCEAVLTIVNKFSCYMKLEV